MFFGVMSHAGAVGWIATRIYHLLLPVDARSDPPYAGTFFICWGDETLNMIVKVPSMALDPVPASAGMTYPCRDDGIIEFWFGF
uniref:Uncharacterized protein n=1 Tax=Candidatus Kentrum sp. LPFa TaxID=2126335 RepID=A0A450WFX5_9GAMM|nr:MAG: hypothetical protein BECKLPF1236A_GA0070988_101373 [Candidatus Kentron sp. LPFa]